MFRAIRPTSANCMTGMIRGKLRSPFACTPLAGINWREFRQAYRVFLGNPEAGIQHILEAARASQWEAWVRQRLLKRCTHLTGQTISVDLPQLAQLPPETLGGSYARHMISLGLDPETFTDDSNPEDWLDQRMAIGHDLYHIVTGFDASPLGEFGVAAFTLIQYWDLLNVFVLSFVPISLTNPQWTLPLLRQLWTGLRMGKKCKPIIGYAFELNWQTPLSQVRQDLGLGPIFAENIL